jgi:uncharacterized protein (TIRG00374 family)
MLLDVSRSPERTKTSASRAAGSWLVAGALAAVLLYWSLRGIDWRRVWVAVENARWGFVLAGAAMTVLAFFLRSIRWRLLLNLEDPNLGIATTFWATMAGYMGNNFLPARGGELMRVLLIHRRSTLSKTYIVTAALTERIVDAVALVLIGSVVLVQVTPKPPWMDAVSRIMALAAFGGGLLIAVLPYLEPWLFPLLRKVPLLPESWRERLLELFSQVLRGLRGFHKPQVLFTFLGFTAVVWTIDALGAWIGTRGYDIHISFPVGLLLITGLGLGSALPSTPGNVGIYQFAAVSVLTPFGVGRNEALAYIIVGQALGYLAVLALGAFGLYRLRGARVRGN